LKEEGIKKSGIPLDEVCPECGQQLVIKEGKYGRFRACSGFPDCGFKEGLVKKEAKLLEENCPECGSQLVLRRGKYGAFVACSNSPECKFIKKEKKDTGISCPLECGGTLVRRKTRKGRLFYGCSTFPKCQFATWDEPVPKPCPDCGRAFVLKKNQFKGKPYLYCSDEKCPYKETIEERESY
jgi:DNA topoisomerase-1